MKIRRGNPIPRSAILSAVTLKILAHQSVRSIFVASCLLVSAAGFADDANSRQPEQGTGAQNLKHTTASDYLVVTANPLATQTGKEIIAKGGSAADATVAVQLVLNLVEPQSSGIGGGAFALWHNSGSGDLTSYDGRETAPAKATPKLFVDANDNAMGFWRAVIGGRSVGVPGTLKLLERLHNDHGVLPWAELVQPAIELARNGFEVSPRMARSIASARGLANFASTREYFFPDGTPLKAGTVLKNAAFAEVLEAIAENGADAFYTGSMPIEIAQLVQSTTSNPGLLSSDDIIGYEVKLRDPVCTTYREHRVCGMGPPSSGMTTVGQILGIIQNFDMASMASSVQGYHHFIEASRLAYADRGRYSADSDFVDVPVDGMVDVAYLKTRASLIKQDSSLGRAEAGTPPGASIALIEGLHRDRAGTTHMSIVDREGNALSMTSTIENGFGSRLMVNGFLLNNELTDFSFVPEKQDLAVANRVQAGKRPRSSMAPTIVYGPDDKIKYIIGSPGGSRIISYVALALVRLIDWQVPLNEVLESGHVLSRNGPVDIEVDSSVDTPALVDGLTALGHEVRVRDLNSGLSAIAISEDGTMLGVADPRREGVAAGE